MAKNIYLQKLRRYYLEDLSNLYKFLVPKKKSVLKIRNNRIPKITRKYDYVIADNCIGEIEDVQVFFSKILKFLKPGGRVIISYYNFIWEPVLRVASYLGLRTKTKAQNWLDNQDIENLLTLSGYDVITRQKRLLIPINISSISSLINNFIAHLPLVNELCLTTYVIARPREVKLHDYSVSIIVPAKNESENIPNIVKGIPKFGTFQEIIFVEGGSTDDTWARIEAESKKRTLSKIQVKTYKQKGIGKADAVRFGFRNATGEILMIYDADMTVDPKDLKKFYEVLRGGLGEFVHGSRLVYPLEKDAMQTLNKFFNKLASLIFTWILGQRFKDTLCGTKAFFKRDYQDIKKLTGLLGKDPFGDFDLIFGAVKLNLKVSEIPVPYKKRVYGKTNISRFKNGLQLIKMMYKSFAKFKLLQQ